MFDGEIMTCAVCGKTEQSDPDKESNWTRVQLDEEDPNSGYYVCPQHLGNPKWSAKRHERQWYKVLKILIIKHKQEG